MGVTTRRPAPRFATQPFRRGPTAARLRDTADATVVVWPDTFTDTFRPGVADDLVAVLEATGERVAVPSGWACCGRTLYDAGMLDRARRTLTGLLDVLEPWTARGIPVVVPEPSCLAAFRDELPAMLPDDPRALVLAGLARSPAEHLLASDGFAAAVARRPSDGRASPRRAPSSTRTATAGRSARPAPTARCSNGSASSRPSSTPGAAGWRARSATAPSTSRCRARSARSSGCPRSVPRSARRASRSSSTDSAA